MRRPLAVWIVLGAALAGQASAQSARTCKLKPDVLDEADVLPLALRRAVVDCLPDAWTAERVPVTTSGGSLTIAATEGNPARTRIGRKPKAVEVQGPAGPRQLLVYADGDGYEAGPADLWVGKVGRERVEFLDADGDGDPFGDGDWMRAAGGSFYRQHAERLVVLGDELFAYEPDLEAKTITLRAVECPAGCNELQWRALATCNTFRSASGLSPMRLDEARSDACQKHAVYLYLNGYDYKKPWDGVGSHDEVPGNPGYTKEGHEASHGHATGSGSDAAGTILRQTHTMLHRLSFLGDAAGGLGVGACDQSKVGTSGYSVVGGDTPRITTADELLVVPAPGQRDVPHEVNGERPAVEADAQFYQRARGYPISVSYGSLALRGIDIELSVDGRRPKPVAGTVFSHEKPIHSTRASNGHTAFFVADQPLDRGTSYRVVFRATLDGEPFVRTWTFETR